MKRLICFIALPLFFIALPLIAATTVQTVTEVSAQQAIIRVRTAQASCSHNITEALSGTTPDDVNASIFFESNLDTRPGSLVNGPDRTFVFGQRASAQGSDGLIHSRSAKVNTAYQDVVTCGADSPVTVYFITGNIQNGGTYLEQPPYCSAGFGNWCWPSIDWSNQSKQYADPETGIVIQRVDAPGWWGQQRVPTNFDFVIGGTGYTNPQNILNGAGCAGTSATCAQSANANPIFVSMKGQNYSFAGPGSSQSSGYNTPISYDDVLLMLTGKASAAEAESVSVCLSYYSSGTDPCDSGSQSIPLSTAVSTVGFPANGVGYSGGANQWNPQFQFGEWAGTAPKQGDFAAAYGAASAGSGVTTSGTAVTGNCAAVSASGACFNPKWHNAYFYVEGSGCTDGGTDICQIDGHPADSQHLTLKHPPAVACSSQCDWNSLASGFVITPNGAGTVDIGAQYSFAFSTLFEILAEGDQQICNPVPVSVDYEADGMTAISPPVSGNLCWIQFQVAPSAQDGVLFLLIPSTGETRLLSPLFAPPGVDSADASGDQNNAQIAFTAAPWDGTSGLCLYGWAMTRTSGKSSLYQACYNAAANWKAYSHPLWACGSCFGGGGQAVPGMDPTSGYPGARWPDDPLTYVNISPPSAGKDLLTQIATHNPTYNPTIWPGSGLGLARTVGGHVLFTMAGSGGYPSSLNVFSLSTGVINSWGDTMFSYPIRFCGLHSIEIANVSPGYFGTICNYVSAGSSSVVLGGPFQATPYSVYFSGIANTNTAITASSPMEPCSNYSIAANIQALGATGNVCMHIRMKNVASHTPSAAELALWPSTQNAAWSEPTTLQAGDELALPIQENDLVAAVTAGVTDSQCSSDCLDVILARGVPNSSGQTTTGQSNGWSVQAGSTLAECGAAFTGCGGQGAWVAMNTSGSVSSSAILDSAAFAAHSDGGTGLASGLMTYVLAGYQVRYNKTLAAQAGNFMGANQIVETSPFGGARGSIDIQSYPSNEQYRATSAQEKRWFTDFHHTNPSLGIGPEVFSAIDGTTYSPVGGTSSVYRVGGPAGGLAVNEANYKTNGLQGWAGHNLLEDVSGPSSSLSDSAAYQTCLALASGECRGGSSAGQVFATVPNVPSIKTNCITNWLVENYPCVAVSLPNVAGWLVQHDGSLSYALFENARKMTMGLTGYGRQYEFNTFIPESTGAWGMFKADWADGIRSEIFMAKLPPFAPQNSIPRSTFVNLPVQVPSGAAYAEIEFGYMENGSVQAYYCTSRQDTCTTSGSPFTYPSIDSRTLVSCFSGCTIPIPVIAGRAVYYSIGSSANGTTWTYGAPQVGLVQ